MVLHEINQEFESQRLQLQKANHWADQDLRERRHVCAEVEMRNRLFRENHQDIAKKL